MCLTFWLTIFGTFLTRSQLIDSIHAFAIATATSTTTPDGFFQGLIDEVRVWNRGLSGAEILANLNSEITSDPDLVGRWGLNEGSGTLAADSSASGKCPRRTP